MKHSKKSLVLVSILEFCEANHSYIFHNELIKELCKKQGYGNPFDVTKLDSRAKLPAEFLARDLCVLHLGRGYHCLSPGASRLYHSFESVEARVEWAYRPSLLNEFNDSESNILSVANNQRILHHFLFGEDVEFDKLPPLPAA